MEKTPGKGKLFVVIGLILSASLLAFFGFRFFAGSKTNVQNETFNHSISSAQAFILPLSQATYMPMRDFGVDDLSLGAKAAGLYDVRSERFLFSKNIDLVLPIASITKLMLAVVIMENLPLSEVYSVAAEDINVDGKGADLDKGEEIIGSDLFKILLIKSSNDAALVFERNAKRGGVNLVAKMNNKAKMIGMTQTKFADTAGLDDAGTFSTISDLVKLVRYVGKYPVIWEILKTKSLDVRSINGGTHHLINTNQLLDKIPGVIGGKTGFTDGAGETMVLEVYHNQNRDMLISVILGSLNRFAETARLIEWGKNAYKWSEQE
jgi:D-alanyl-D-alanine carboxypeptidase